MPSRPDLPDLRPGEFQRATEAAVRNPGCLDGLDRTSWDRLFQHYRMLRRWSRSVGLIGRGTGAEAPARHYAESLAGLEFLPPGACLDFGSGGGFPGMILACCRPEQPFVLLEARQRKAAFLEQVAAAAGLERCHVEPGRWQTDSVVESFAGMRAAHPFAALTVRAVNVEPWRCSLQALLEPGAVWLAWGRGAQPAVDQHGWAPGGEVTFDGKRRLTVFRRDEPAGGGC